jgi:hypothetical protein
VQGCQVFIRTKYQNGKIYIKGQHNLPKGLKIYKNGCKYAPNGHKICQQFPFQGPPKYSRFGTFGLIRDHLATLLGI